MQNIFFNNHNSTYTIDLYNNSLTEIDLATSTISPNLYSSNISAGVPSPVDDNIECHLDLNKLLINNSNSTFFINVDGDDMGFLGINNGDLLIVDRSAEPHDGNIVIATLNEELSIESFVKKNNISYLVNQNEEYIPIPIKELVDETVDMMVWGVVTTIIHKV